MQSNFYLTTVNAFGSRRCNFKSLLLLSLLLVTSITYSYAQGTFCDDPIVIGCGESVINSTTGIDNDNATSGAGSCLGISVGTGGQLWFALTPLSTGPVTISMVDATTNFDSKLHLYTGICGNLQCVAANDDFDMNNGITSSQITSVNLTQGITYLIRVGGYQALEGFFSLSISTCAGVVEGCTDVVACNFNPSANLDDGTCIYPGCNVPEACNYDESAGCDDGSCCFTTCNTITVTSGLEPLEVGWTIFSPGGQAIATGGAPAVATVCVNDPSCDYTLNLTDSYGDGWSGATYTITSPEGIVEATGTLSSDNIANPNFQTADVSLSLGGAVSGCTDNASTNFNPNATCDNGSCIYCESGSTVLKVILEDSNGDGWDGAQLSLLDASNTELINATLPDGFIDSVQICATSGCYSVEVTDGSFPVEISWSILDVDNNTILEGIAGQLIYFGWDGAEGCVIEGCTNSTACNYDATANFDDGSCIYSGCTEISACNYNALAGCDDGSCCFNSCVNITVTAGDFPGEVSWQLLDNSSAVIAEGGAPANVNVCLLSPVCAGIFATYDTYGDGWNGANYTISNGGEIQATGTLDTLDFGENIVNIGDLTLGCTDPAAVNFNASADCEDESCIYSGCNDPVACNYDANATINDNTCTYPGCVDIEACNYSSDAGCGDNSCEYPLLSYLTCSGDCINDTDNDGVCNEIEIAGCSDVSACNFDAAATDPAECIFPLPFLDCLGNCLIDTDDDGVCDPLEILGCTDITACNFDFGATENDGSCSYPEANFDCQGNCINDINSNGICDELENGGCTDFSACNYDPTANVNDNSCTFAGCIAVDACNYDADAGCDDGSCEFPGCTDSEACNFDISASCDNGSCVFPGCQDPIACNYDSAASCASNTCIYPGPTFDCNGNCINDTDNDGVCDELEILGCTDISACNYDANATDNSSCEYPAEFYNCDGSCISDTDNDGLCDQLDLEGCTDILACNYNSSAVVDDFTCSYPGCSDSSACNFDPNALCSNGSCDFGGCSIPFACNYDSITICPNDALCEGIPGSPCDDANPFTTGETYDENCNCVATAINSIYDIVAASSVHNTLQTALEASGLDAVLDAPGEFTLFAPTDDAFAALPAGTLEALLADPNGALTDILLYHTVGAVALSSVLENGMVIATLLQGQDVLVTIDSSGIFINDAQVTIADITADNGVVHVIDAVLIPQIPESNTIYDIVAASSVHNTLQTALEASGLDAVLDAPGAYTLFAPTDAAFAALPAGTVETLLADPNGELTNILLYHVLNSTVLSTDLANGLIVPTLQGQDVLVTIVNNDIFINDAQVIIADITADNGVVHMIDAVLIPQEPVVGCTDTTACNYNALAVEDDGSCNFGGCTDLAACNYDMNAACERNELCNYPGCTDTLACNYDAFAVCSSSICFYPDGCTDVNACNYNPSASCNDGSCEYSADEFYDCDGNCYFDTDGDGICDAFETSGCTDPSACNYSPFVFEDDGSCVYPGCTDTFACNFDFLAGCDDGTCSFPGCTVFPSCNYNPEAGCDDGSCVFGGCADSAACNYDEGAQCDDGSCYYSNAYFDCDSVCYNDANTNGICDEFEVPGCTDPGACNYSPIAIIDNGLCTYPGCDDSTACNYVGFVGCPDSSCIYPGCTDATACNFNPLTICDDGSCIFPGCQDSLACNYDPAAACNGFNCLFANFPFDCSGNCVNDTDGDLTCDELEILGCTDSDACNFNPEATEDNGSCTFPPQYYNCDSTCISDQDSDGVCDAFETTGCTDSLACNYNSFVSINDFTCTYPGCNDTNACNYEPSAGCLDFSCFYAETYFDCNGNCNNDADANGICDEFEVTGCTDFTACNYDILAFIDDGSCSYPGCTDPNACNFDFAAICDDGLCSFPGCTSPEACNYDSLAICDDGSCTFPGCSDPTACNYDNAASCSNNNLCTYSETYYNCLGQCLNDADGDLLCDELEIAGCLDANACNFNIAATDPADCTYPETFYNCDGTCELDSDNDGICDPLDDLGCTDSLACNYNSFAINSDGNCTYPGCIDITACNFNDTAACDDGSCILPACLDSLACNYLPNYSCDGGECTYPTCGDTLACNYDTNAVCTSADYCQYPLTYYNCNGQCILDSDADGVCDELEVLGCTDENACNYNSAATESIDICTYPETYYNCDGVCLEDADLDGICDVFDLAGCMDPIACNYNSFAIESDNSCTYPGCTDNSSCNYDVTAACDNGTCIPSGCLDALACNYNSNAGCEDGSCVYNSCGDPLACNFDSNYLCGDISLCTYAQQYQNCEGFCINDQDNDGICDEIDIAGCTDINACNYNPYAIESDGNCTYAFLYYDCNGICINDDDGDGVCSELEVPGCTDFAACNFNPSATEDDTSCTFPELYYDCFGNCLQDSDNDNICDALDNSGCLDSTACDYNPFATISNGICNYPETYYDCDGICLNDADNDGICDALEIAGCIIPSACNFNPLATDYDSTCVFPGCTNELACNFDPTAGCDNNTCYLPIPGFLCDGTCDGDSDNDGLCDYFETNGCTDSVACNYNPYASVDDFTCTYPGCTDPNACNYDANAGCDQPESCELPVPYYNCDGSCESDVDADGICDPFEITGCTDPAACNYNPFIPSNADDGSCTEVVFATENISVTSDSFPNGYEWNGALLITSGEYVWVGTTSAGCDSIVTLTFEYVVVIATNDILYNDEIELWPNPTRDFIQVRSHNNLLPENIVITDINGKVVITDSKSLRIDVSQLAAGLYIMRINSNGTSINKRFEILK